MQVLQNLKKNKIFNQNICKGFSILEMVVATALFIIIAMMTTNLIFSLNKQNQSSLAEKKLYDALFITLDDMSKNIREGYNYSTSTNLLGDYIFSFVSQDLKKEEYVFIKGNGDNGYIQKNIYANTTGSILEKTIRMTNSDINIQDAKIEFKPHFKIDLVYDDNSSMKQPFVKIVLKGNSISKPEAKFEIQTSINQRSKVNRP
jgi:type II secretory pathway component PulJ